MKAKYIIKILILCLILAATGESYAVKTEKLDTLFKAGNNAYNQGLYDSAAAIYQTILNQGVESGELYYNLGNAYFKAGDIPSAILYYEKAKKLIPNDEDVIYNLNIANSRIVDKIEKIPVMFYKKWWNYFYNMFSDNTWALFSLITFAILVLFVGMFILGQTAKTKRIAFFSGLLFLFLTAVSFGMASQKYYYGKSHTEAIVFIPTVTVKSSPSANSVDLFVIHEGTKVSILDKVDNWVKIKIQNGSIGWLPAQDLKEI
jgi:tetratricopeptide (TPR) repeat protein